MTSKKPAAPIPSWARTTAVEWVYRNAARDGDSETVDQQLQLGCAVDCMNVEGRTALMLAAENGQVECVATILKAPTAPDLELTNLGGMTAFTLACFHGSAECGEALLRAGCKRHTRDKWGQTAMDRAVDRDYVAVVEMIQRVTGQVPPKKWYSYHPHGNPYVDSDGEQSDGEDSD